MEGNIRRNELIKILKNNKTPVSGTDLAGQLGVSRQVIVQDVALLRAGNKNILSTNKGYMLYNNDKVTFTRSFAVEHTDDEIEDELITIVNYGGKILDVVVAHDIYGQIMVDLLLETVADVKEFVQKIKNCKTRPLKDLAENVHFHTVEANSSELLDIIEDKLRQKGYLV